MAAPEPRFRRRTLYYLLDTNLPFRGLFSWSVWGDHGLGGLAAGVLKTAARGFFHARMLTATAVGKPAPRPFLCATC
jgi:hypothetical protein